MKIKSTYNHEIKVNLLIVLDGKNRFYMTIKILSRLLKSLNAIQKEYIDFA